MGGVLGKVIQLVIGVGGASTALRRVTHTNNKHTDPRARGGHGGMARAAADTDTHMEDQGVGMEEAGHGPGSRSSLRETYHSDTLLAPGADFMTDEHSSAASGMDVADRLTYLEQRVQMQEDEIQLLKTTLADVLKRLNISEENQAAGRRAPPGVKARPVSLALPTKPSVATPSTASLKKSTTLPSASRAQSYTAAPTTSKSAVKSPTDSPSKTTRARPPSTAPTCKKPHESSSKAAKEPAVSVGSRRVTHCKVTMQIYLSPLTRRTGSFEAAKSAPAVPNTRAAGAPPAAPQAKGGARNDRARLEICETTPAFALPLKKTTTYSPMDTLSYKSPIKSPGQYFQICY